MSTPLKLRQFFILARFSSKDIRACKVENPDGAPVLKSQPHYAKEILNDFYLHFGLICTDSILRIEVPSALEVSRREVILSANPCDLDLSLAGAV